MKWTIEGFSQAEALKFQKQVVDKKTGKSKIVRVDCGDLIILRWLVDFYPKMIKVEVDGVQYVWVSYKDLLEDMPLLNIGKQMLAVRLKKLCDFGILKHQVIKQNGTFSYYGFGKNYFKLIKRDNDNNNERSIKNYIGVDNKLDTPYKNNIEQINTFTKYNTSTKNNIYNDEFEKLWKIYPKKQGKTKAHYSFIKARQKGTTFEEIESGLKRYIAYVDKSKIKSQYIKQGSTWFNQQCWKDEYEEHVVYKKQSESSFDIDDLDIIK